jgi:hypothetical protein
VSILHMTDPSGFWHLERSDSGAWLRVPLVAWGLVDDGPEIPNYVAPLRLDRTGLVVEVAPPVGRVVHETEFRPCSCSVPTVAIVDASFCCHCAGLVTS